MPCRTSVWTALAVGLSLLTVAASTPARQARAQTVCDAATQFDYSFVSQCSEPIWLGERSTGDTASYPPQGGSWAIAATCSSNADCASGICDQDSSQCTCNGSSQCGGAVCQPDGKCSTWLDVCIPQTWSSGTFWPRTGCVLDESASPATLTCQTGACYSTANTGQQLLDCSVSNQGGSPTNPVTQFEVTSTAASVNYDVSIAAGYNVETIATPIGGGWIAPGTPATQIASCLAAGCTADLNLTCPAALQVLSGGEVIGCLDPCTQCQRSPGDLQCSNSSPETWTSCTGATGSVTNQDLYCAKNDADGNAQASPNQGTPTSFGPLDCPPFTSFTIPTFATGYALPPGQGVCLYLSPPQSGIAHFNDYGWADGASGTTKNCGGTPPDYSALPDGTACGGYLTPQSDGATGYPDGLGYTCQTAMFQDSGGTAQTAHLCMPPTESGLGMCTADSVGGLPLYTGGGGVSNAAWLAAGLVAGGGTTPYYDTFKQACPAAYAWQYDDIASGFACTVGLSASGQDLVGFAVSFCGSEKPTPLDRLPPGAVVALAATGASAQLGSATKLGHTRIRGRFTPPDDLPLDQASLRLVNVLDESGGSGELVLALDGGAALPLVLTRSPTARPQRVRFESAPGFYPHVVVKLVRRLEAGAPDPVDVSIEVDQGPVAAPSRCSAGRASSTSLETSFDLQVGSGRALRVGGFLPWACRGPELRLRREVR